MTKQENPTYKFDSLGTKGPYRLVDYWYFNRSLQSYNVEGYNHMMRTAPKVDIGGIGSCSYCGTPIIHHYIVVDSTGKSFFTGCECVLKINHGLKKDMESFKPKRDKAVREASLMKRNANYNNFLKENEDYYRSLPHDNDYFAKRGKSFFDYLVYCGKDASKNTQHKFMGIAKEKLNMNPSLYASEVERFKNLIEGYNKEVAEQEAERKRREESRLASKHKFEVGAKFEGLELTCEFSTCTTSNWAYTTYLNSFIDKDKNCFVWFTNKKYSRGEIVTLKGTVKSHTYYQDRAQTIITRCKEIEIEAA